MNRHHRLPWPVESLADFHFFLLQFFIYHTSFLLFWATDFVFWVCHLWSHHPSPVHGSCCRADCCCLLLKKRADQSASSSGGERNVGREAVYDVILLLPAAVAADRKKRQPDSRWWNWRTWRFRLMMHASRCNRSRAGFWTPLSRLETRESQHWLFILTPRATPPTTLHSRLTQPPESAGVCRRRLTVAGCHSNPLQVAVYTADGHA